MTIYKTVKENVTVWQAAEHYGLTVQRNGMCCCPFHRDLHPSMKLNEDYFFCFGCGAHGDVIDFVTRLFGISSYEAAQKLAYDFEIDPDKPPAAAALKKPEYPLAKAFQRDEMRCQPGIVPIICICWRTGRSDTLLPGPEESWDDRFVEAGQMLDYIEYLTDILTFAELEVRVKAVDMLKKNGTVDRLEERLNKLNKEKQAHGKEQELE